MMKDRIRLIRSKKGLTQDQFAQELDLSKSTVQKWEYGVNEPDKSSIALISATFNVDPDWIITGEGEDPFRENAEGSMDWVERILRNRNPFAQNLFKQFAEFGDEEWLLLEKIVDALALKKSEKKERES